MTPEAVTPDQLKAAVARHATQDPAFRAALLADPKAAVEKLLGTDLPGHVQVQAIEEAPDTYVVVLPARAVHGELSDADLEAVAGGSAKVGDRGAQKAASLMFGGNAAAPTFLIGKIAEAAKDKNAGKILDAASQIMYCGA